MLCKYNRKRAGIDDAIYEQLQRPDNDVAVPQIQEAEVPRPDRWPPPAAEPDDECPPAAAEVDPEGEGPSHRWPLPAGRHEQQADEQRSYWATGDDSRWQAEVQLLQLLGQKWQ